MNNLQKALKEMDEEWFASLPDVDEVPHFETSEAFKEWEQRVIYGNVSEEKTIHDKEL